MAISVNGYTKKEIRQKSQQTKGQAELIVSTFFMSLHSWCEPNYGAEELENCNPNAAF